MSLCAALLVLQLSDMELTKQQANVVAALKQGNEALKKAQQEVGPSAVVPQQQGNSERACSWQRYYESSLVLLLLRFDPDHMSSE